MTSEAIRHGAILRSTINRDGFRAPVSPKQLLPS